MKILFWLFIAVTNPAGELTTHAYLMEECPAKEAFQAEFEAQVKAGTVAKYDVTCVPGPTRENGGEPT